MSIELAAITHHEILIIGAGAAGIAAATDLKIARVTSYFILRGHVFHCPIAFEFGLCA